MTEVRVPDIGDFADVPVIEVLVAPGDTRRPRGPADHAGVRQGHDGHPRPGGRRRRRARGEGGRQGVRGQPRADAGAGERRRRGAGRRRRRAGRGGRAGVRRGAPAADAGSDRVDVVVLGSGPGGYTAAFRAADLGLETVLVERYERLGGVCLNVGCIPSKALLHVARVIAESEEAAAQGVRFGAPEIDLDGVRAFKDGAVEAPHRRPGRHGQAAQGAGRARTRRASPGRTRSPWATRRSPSRTASSPPARTPCSCPGFPEDPRIIDSTGALELADVPERLLVVGGGIIGLEMASVYDALGSRVTVVELLDQLIPGADPDVVRPLQKRISGRYEAIHLKTGVESVEATDDGLVARFGDHEETFDRILVAVGRRPNGAQHRRRGRRRRGRRARLHRRRRPAAHERAAHLRHRRRRRRADARPQGDARGARWRPR